MNSKDNQFRGNLFHGKSSQFWYIDFITAMLIFICGFLIFVFYTNNVMDITTGTNAESISENTAKISELLFSKGSPYGWTSDSFDIPGVICDGTTIDICPRKIIELTRTDYKHLKNTLGTRFDFRIYFSWIDSPEYGNISLIAFGDRCGVNINATPGSGMLAAAYFGNPSGNESSEAGRFGISDTYSSADIGQFISDLGSYRTIIMFDPDLSSFNQGQIEALERFVFDGNSLIAIGNVDSEFLELEFTPYGKGGIWSYLDPEEFRSKFNRHTIILPESSSNRTINDRITISNQFLRDKLDNKNSNSYKFMINSNVSNIVFVHKAEYNNSVFPTMVFERYGLGRFYYFNDIATENITRIVNDTIRSSDIRECIIDDSELVDGSYKSISKITRIGKIYSRVAKMTVISYERE